MVNYSLFDDPALSTISNTTIAPRFTTEPFEPFQLVMFQIAAFTRELGNFSDPACIFSFESSKFITSKLCFAKELFRMEYSGTSL